MMRIFFSVVMELIFLQRRKKQLAVKGRISSWVTLKFPLLKKFLQFLFRLVSTSCFFHSFVAGAEVAAQWSSKRLIIKRLRVRLLLYSELFSSSLHLFFTKLPELKKVLFRLLVGLLGLKRFKRQRLEHQVWS